MIQEATIDTYMPVTTNKVIELDGVLSFSIHNAGTSVATLDGNYTLQPGSTLSSGMPAPNVVISDKMRVSFAAGGSNKLEMITVRLKGAEFSNYQHKSPQ